MSNSIHVSIANWPDDEIDLMRVRDRVFIQEQNVPPELEHDADDVNYTHAKACLEDGTVVGTARLLPSGYIGRMAVLQEHRGAGIGSALLKTLIKEAQHQGHTQICLNAQVSAIDFYQKLGFTSKGKRFMEAGIEHQNMCLHKNPVIDKS